MSRLKKYDQHNYIQFITAVTYKRIPVLTMDGRFPKFFLENLEFYRGKYDFMLHGFCLLPDHFHILGYLPENQKLSDFLRDFKGFTAKKILDILKQGKSSLLEKLWAGQKGRRKDGLYKVFQEDTFVYNIFSERKLEEKLDYIHRNPVEAGLAKEEKDWPYSSWRNYHLGDHSLIKVDVLYEMDEAGKE
ncbi:MAG: transposase [candidate division Zixibacteria bacterium]|nr:transposase [candidate division Zixibacteria bacterium]